MVHSPKSPSSVPSRTSYSLEIILRKTKSSSTCPDKNDSQTLGGWGLTCTTRTNQGKQAHLFLTKRTQSSKLLRLFSPIARCSVAVQLTQNPACLAPSHRASDGRSFPELDRQAWGALNCNMSDCGFSLTLQSQSSRRQGRRMQWAQLYKQGFSASDPTSILAGLI